jgi:proteasome lid subunit RPN8/RPN11
MSAMERLMLAPGVLEAVTARAREALPMEAVGLLGGRPDGRATLVLPLPNLAGARAFLADPYAQYQAEQALQQQGLVPLAVYHSHPGGGVELSEADRHFARAIPLVQVVIALDRPHRPDVELCAYRVQGSVVHRVRILPHLTDAR